MRIDEDAQLEKAHAILDALDPFQLTAKQVRDFAINLAADMVAAKIIGMGAIRVSRVIRSAGVIDRIKRSTQPTQAFAKKLAERLKSFTKPVGESIATTAEGIPVRIATAGEETMSFQQTANKVGGALQKAEGLLTTLENDVQYICKNVDGRNFLEIKHPVLENIRTGHALKPDLYHAFNNIIDNFARDAQKFALMGKDGFLKTLYQIEGSFDGVPGIFEWIVDSRPDHGVTHRFFIKNGKITGKPNIY